MQLTPNIPQRRHQAANYMKTSQLHVATAVFEPAEDYLDHNGAQNVAEDDFMDNVPMTSNDPARFQFKFNRYDTYEKCRRTR